MSGIGKPIREIEVLPIFLPGEAPAEVVPEPEAEPVETPAEATPAERTHAHGDLV